MSQDITIEVSEGSSLLDNSNNNTNYSQSASAIQQQLAYAKIDGSSKNLSEEQKQALATTFFKTIYELNQQDGPAMSLTSFIATMLEASDKTNFFYTLNAKLIYNSANLTLQFINEIIKHYQILNHKQDNPEERRNTITQILKDIETKQKSFVDYVANSFFTVIHAAGAIRPGNQSANRVISVLTIIFSATGLGLACLSQWSKDFLEKHEINSTNEAKGKKGRLTSGQFWSGMVEFPGNLSVAELIVQQFHNVDKTHNIFFPIQAASAVIYGAIKGVGTSYSLFGNSSLYNYSLFKKFTTFEEGFGTFCYIAFQMTVYGLAFTNGVPLWAMITPLILQIVGSTTKSLYQYLRDAAPKLSITQSTPKEMEEGFTKIASEPKAHPINPNLIEGPTPEDGVSEATLQNDNSTLSSNV